MQGSLLLAKISRNFIWGTTIEKKKLHLVSWRMVTRPKADGFCGTMMSYLDKFIRS